MSLQTEKRGPGRPAFLSKADQKAILNMLRNTDKTVAQLAKIYKCHPRNIYNTVGSKEDALKVVAAQANARLPHRNGKSRIHKSKKH